LYELLTSETFYDTGILGMPKNPDGAFVLRVYYKSRFNCPGCKHDWTSGKAQFAVILLLKRAPGNLFSVTFRVIAYWFDCIKCKRKGNMRAYESEMERVAVIVTKRVLQEFGYKYPK
jgi:hypothetical protein